MKLVRYMDEEWSALYADGKLIRYGDHYLVDEKLSELLNVEIRNGEEAGDFLLGTNREAALTLDEVEEYTAAREAKEALGTERELQEELEQLEQRAEALRRSLENKQNKQ